MNWAYLHLVVNHFPIIGTIIGSLLLIAGMAFKNQGIKIGGLGTLVFSALMSILAYFTGDPAEEAVKNHPDVARSLISLHESLATISMYILIPTGLIAATAIFSLLKKEKYPNLMIIITLVLALGSSSIMVFVGRTGGQIRHNEFRNEATKQYILQHQNDKEEDD